MSQYVEHHVCSEDPVDPLRQFSLVQFYREEKRDYWKEFYREAHMKYIFTHTNTPHINFLTCKIIQYNSLFFYNVHINSHKWIT